MACEAGSAGLNLLQTSGKESFWIVKVAWQHYSIPLTKTLSTGELAKHRKGLLVKITLGSTQGMIEIKFMHAHPHIYVFSFQS